MSDQAEYEKDCVCNRLVHPNQKETKKENKKKTPRTISHTFHLDCGFKATVAYLQQAGAMKAWYGNETQNAALTQVAKFPRRLES